MRKIPTKRNVNTKQSVFVHGVSNIKVILAPCCSPLPGDEIRGYITRGQGVKVHRKDCPNIQNEGARTIDVEWNPDATGEYPVSIEILSNDRNNLVVDVMSLFSSLKIMCNNLHAKSHLETSTATLTVSLLVSDLTKLQEVFRALKSIDGVYEVRRLLK